MKIKVCGLKQPENIEELLKLQPDFMGFIFYKKSPRFVANQLDSKSLNFNGKPQSVGVFVNSPEQEVIDIVNNYQLDYVQLHGSEPINYTQRLHAAGIKIIKAFQIHEKFDWTILKKYVDNVNYFLFDTPTKNYGGSGLKFDWQNLKNYKDNRLFFLSGGIEIGDVPGILKLNLPKLYGIDVNSKFETEPGIKNIELVKKLINKTRTL